MRIGFLIVFGGALSLGACVHHHEAPVGQPIGGAVESGASLNHSLEQRRDLAKRYLMSGELAAAEIQWQILVLLAPDNVLLRKELDGTREALSRAVVAAYQDGLTALKDGNAGEAFRLMLRVLALDPDHPHAPDVLRKIETKKIGLIQAQKVARARREEGPSVSRAVESLDRTAENGRAFKLEQMIELFSAGDLEGGIGEFGRYVSANPHDKPGRNRIASVVFEQARKLETDGSRERAARFYELALSLRGDSSPTWEAQLKVLRKTLANENYEKGLRAYRTDLGLAIKYWESSLRYNPEHINAALRLKEARSYQENMKRINAVKNPQ